MGKVKEELIKYCEELSDKYEVDYYIIEWLVHRYGGRAWSILENKKTRYVAMALYYAEEALYETIG